MKRFIIIAALALIPVAFVSLIGLAKSLEVGSLDFVPYAIYSAIALILGGIAIKVLSYFDPEDLD